MVASNSKHVKDTIGLYLESIGEYNRITSEDETDLFRRAKLGDDEARKVLINSNLKLVVHIAKKYRRMLGSLTFEDLIQEGNIGLIKAIGKFNPEKVNPETGRPFRLSKYASDFIEGAIVTALKSQSRLVKLPENKTRLLRTYYRTIDNLENILGFRPLDGVVAEEMGISLENLLSIKRTDGCLSLDCLADSMEDDTQLDDIKDDRISTPLAELLERDRQSDLEKSILLAIEKLGEREARIVERCFGFNGYDQLSTGEVAEIEGCDTRTVNWVLRTAYESIIQELKNDLKFQEWQLLVSKSRSRTSKSSEQRVNNAYREFDEECKKEIISAHRAFSGIVSEVCKHLGYSRNTIIKYWMEAGLTPRGRKTIGEDDKRKIEEAFVTYNGSAEEATKHVPYSNTTLMKYWKIMGLKIRSSGGQKKYVDKDTQIMEEAFFEYGGIVSKAARHIPYSTKTITRCWKAAGLVVSG